mgnify:FL=1|jgi:hypothetical protein
MKVLYILFIITRRKTLRRIKQETFEKISVKRTIKKEKRDDWKRERQAHRKVKRNIQEKNFA